MLPAAAFEYAATPSVDALSPATGSADGGTEITMNGAHLSGATEVTVRHRGLSMEQGEQEGWTETLDRLVRLFESAHGG